MICIILVAGHGTLLEKQISGCPTLSHLSGVPKALLPGVGGKKILDFWWEVIKARQLFSEVYLVTNADKYKHYERWATASDFPVENIINDGTTTHSNRLGPMLDMDLVLKSQTVSDDVMVVAGDMLFQDAKFDVAQVLQFFHSHSDGELAIYYQMEPDEETATRGIVEVDKHTHKITHFYEKPCSSDVTSRLASVVFYCFRRESLSFLQEYISETQHVDQRTFGRFMEWYINIRHMTVYGMNLPTGFQLIGQVSLEDYQRWIDYFSEKTRTELHQLPITKRGYARVGLVGNPSDGFHGKTIALSITNFWSDVTLVESEKLTLVPHPLNDPTEFGSLSDLHGISRKEGYFGGLRLLQATCKKFYQYCSQHGVALAKRNFTLKYDTNIPRQVGLAGSSAIVSATMQCLMQFFNLTETDLPKNMQPAFILSVEMDELGIQAGLQDRVVQVYEGLVYMDFSLSLIEQQGYGNYINLPVDDLPTFWLAYLGDPSDSGKIHSTVKQRWKNGDVEVVQAMKKFAELTDNAKNAINNKDWSSLISIMNDNFDLRRDIYGDPALGAANLKMVEIGRSFGSACKFPGSGGAVVGLCLDPAQMLAMKSTFQSAGYVFCELSVNKGGNQHNLPS